MAEVLITLGIIGVVAAITMPTLIQTYKKQVVETRLKRFYTTMNQAVKLAENQYGDWHDWDFDINETLYNKYLKNYLKDVRVESKNSKTYYYFSDGSGFYPVYNNPDNNNRKGHIEMLYCPFGFSKCNVSGKNRFSFVFNMSVGVNRLTNFKNPIEVYTYGWDGTLLNLKNDNLYGNYGCNNLRHPTREVNTYCTALIMMNGWKIPDDYPYKF